MSEISVIERHGRRYLYVSREALKREAIPIYAVRKTVGYLIPMPEGEEGEGEKE